MPRISKANRQPQPRGPGYEGKRSLVPATVPDPYDKSSLKVVKNIGGDTIEMMYHRQQIDVAQYEAARKIRRLHEASGAVGARAIDYTREHVDGGKVWTGILDVKLSAADQLAGARFELGRFDYHLVLSVAGEGARIKDMAVELGRDAEDVGKRLRLALEYLAKLWKIV